MGIEVNKNTLMKFGEFIQSKQITEKIEVDIKKKDVEIRMDETCITTVWNTIMTQSAGTIEGMKKYLKSNHPTEDDDIEITDEMVIKHIMNLVDDYLNNAVEVKSGSELIKNFDHFVATAAKLDYVSVCEELLKRIFGCKNKEQIPPAVKTLLKNLMDEVGGGECENEDDFEEEEEE